MLVKKLHFSLINYTFEQIWIMEILTNNAYEEVSNDKND